MPANRKTSKKRNIKNWNTWNFLIRSAAAQSFKYWNHGRKTQPNSDARSSDFPKPTFTHNLDPKMSPQPNHQTNQPIVTPFLYRRNKQFTVLHQLGITFLKFAAIQGQHRGAKGQLQGVRALRALPWPGPELLLHLFALDESKRWTKSLGLGWSNMAIICHNHHKIS